MACQKYQSFRFSDETLSVIETVRKVIEDFVAQGFVLTLRQIYYQLVAKDLFPEDRRWTWTGTKWIRDSKGTKNALPNYKWLGNIINDGRLAGLIDWDAIEDRMRSFIRRQRWDSGKQILTNAAKGFHMDMWINQPCRLFIIIEKDALVGVLTNVCQRYDVPVLAARGYPSSSVLREFALQDIIPYADQHVVIIHLGDHDPSGLDMTRDLTDRIRMFAQEEDLNSEIEFSRIALNMDQIRSRRPPPNPAKVTDSRFAEYQRKFGNDSWELDALPPSFIVDLVEDQILLHRDEDAWETREKQVKRVKSKLTKVAKEFKE